MANELILPKKITDLVCEPHSGISSRLKTPTLNLSAKTSEQTRQISTELTNSGYMGLMKDIKILRKHYSNISQSLTIGSGQQRLSFLNLENKEFDWHPIVTEDFSKSRYLDKILYKVCEHKPKNYEKILALQGVGPKTMRALSLVSEVIYGAKPSYEDPARYSFAFGGKDGTPYPVDRPTYDSTIDFFQKIIGKMRVSNNEKTAMLKKLPLLR